MAKQSNQRAKILYLLKILWEETDEEHVLSMTEILDRLSSYGIPAERKSIYADIDALCQFGFEIAQQRETPRGYYLADRQFELAELKILVDTVQASKFLSVRKSSALIHKLEQLASKYEANGLQRQVVVSNRVKTVNESIYYNVDKLHNAISGNCKISFQYAQWDTDKEMHLRRDGKYYSTSPWKLAWTDENYYLIAYDESTGQIRHYRVDKMVNITLQESPREGKEIFEKFDLAGYLKMTFGMFGGDPIDMTILFENGMIGVVLDRLGTDVKIMQEDGDHFKARIRVIPSPQFYGWLAGLGVSARILSPESAAREYYQYLRDLVRQYEE